MHKTRGFSISAVVAVGLISLQYVAPQQAHSACVLTPGPGNDTFVCDSDSSPGLSDLSGNNILTLPAGGSGTIYGNVTFGAGTDALRIDSGLITGGVKQGDGIDDFIMSGGQIQSLAQGDGRDTFLMTGGTIVGAFDDGDVARQTSGTIGRVNMKLDKNLYDMSGGEILGNLVTGFDTDTIFISGGTIGGNISTSGGDDSITVSGGVINGEIRASVGNDTFQWLNRGQIKSSVLMGDGDDRALLRGLSENLLATTPTVDGGLGNDQLSFDATKTSSTGARYLGWETVNLNNNSRLNLAGDFFLGDSGSITGTFNIDGSSTLAVTQGSIRPYTAGHLATLNNAGTIDMTDDNSATSVLTVNGNYMGNNGQLRLQTVLGDENSATDKLVVSDGSISGHTQLGVSNLGGLGGLTRNNGIEVVQALNGAVSSIDAFSLRSSMSAGAYEYMLFKGGVTAGTENNWYLRSSVVAVQPPVVPPVPPTPLVMIPVPPIPPTLPLVAPDEPPVEPPTAQPVAPIEPPALPPSLVPAAASPEPAANSPPLPIAVAGAEPIPLYRLEVPVYSVTIPAAQVMTLQALGAFHDRQGEQSLLTETGAVPAGWGRAYGSNFNKRWSGTVAPSFDGTVKGYQVGHDLYAAETGDGQIQRFGLFVGQSRLRGDVKGFSMGFQTNRSGRVKLDGDNFGVYWTLTDPADWYVDLVAMGTRLDGDNKSKRGVKMDTEGHALALSAEAGYPITLSEHWVVEPQAQLIIQKIALDNQNDGISKVSFDSQEYWTGRLGARLKGRYLVNNTRVEPYVRVNAWRTFGGCDTVTYDDVDRIKSDHKASSVDMGVGVVARLSSTVSLYVATDYNTNLDGNALKGVSGNAGVRLSW
ncbi:autotransporter family protein [Pseudomonas antarctica]